MIYVGMRKYKYGRMYLSHMISDIGLKELHKMADTIGVNRKWFQDKKGKPHYDICQKKKELVLKKGGKEVCDKEIIKILKNLEDV